MSSHHNLIFPVFMSPKKSINNHSDNTYVTLSHCITIYFYTVRQNLAFSFQWIFPAAYFKVAFVHGHQWNNNNIYH